MREFTFLLLNLQGIFSPCEPSLSLSAQKEWTAVSFTKTSTLGCLFFGGGDVLNPPPTSWKPSYIHSVLNVIRFWVISFSEFGGASCPPHFDKPLFILDIDQKQLWKMVGFGPADVPPSAAVKFVGAGTAACIADLLTYPLDTAKVRLQVNKPFADIKVKFPWIIKFWMETMDLMNNKQCP